MLLSAVPKEGEPTDCREVPPTGAAGATAIPTAKTRLEETRALTPAFSPGPPGEGEARTVPANSHALWCDIFSWGLATIESLHQDRKRVGKGWPMSDVCVVLRADESQCRSRID